MSLRSYECQPILAQCSISTPPENVRKPLAFRSFQGLYKWNSGVKWVKFNFTTSWEILSFSLSLAWTRLLLS